MLFTCKRIAWEGYLDMPVGLTLRPGPGTGTEIIVQIVAGEPDPRSPAPWPADPQNGWFVILGITNPGIACVRSRDFGRRPGRQLRGPPGAQRRLPPPPGRQLRAHGNPERHPRRQVQPYTAERLLGKREDPHQARRQTRQLLIGVVRLTLRAGPTGLHMTSLMPCLMSHQFTG